MDYSVIESEVLPKIWNGSSKLDSSFSIKKQNSKSQSEDFATSELNDDIKDKIFELQIKSSKDFGKLASSNNNLCLPTNNRKSKSRKLDIEVNLQLFKREEDVSKRLTDIKSPTLVKNIGLYGLISKFYLIKKFVKILRASSNLSIPSSFHSNILEIINDLAYDKNGWSNKGEFFFIRSISSNFFMINVGNSFRRLLANFNFINIPTLDPTKTIRNIWDAFHFVIILFYLFKIPIELSFQVSIFQGISESEMFLGSFLAKLCFIFFVFDLIMNFNTGYYYKGMLVSDRMRITKKYIRSSFIFDGISIIPIIYDAFGGEKHFILEWLFFIRVKTFFQIFLKAQNSIHINFEAYNLIELLKIIIRILLLTHMLACLWHYIGFKQINDLDSWLYYYELTQAEWWKKYLVSYYYISVTINTVGYGDIVPHTTLERLFGTLFIFFACGIFAYTLNAIGTIVQRLQRRKDHFINNLTTINEYMIKKNINIDLRIRIQKYLEYIWKEESFQTPEEQSLIINKLSSSLKEELLLEANGTPLKNISFLRSNFSENTLRKLSYTMQEIRCTPGEIIFFKGEKTNHDMYFVRKGEIQIFDETNNKNKPCVINYIKKGGVFGEISFFTGQEREISAKSVNFTSIFVIKLTEFKRILAENFNDYQRYCQIKDKISIMNDYNDLHPNCSLCKTIGNHLSIHCPNLHLSISKTRILDKNSFSNLNERVLYKRQMIRRHNTISKFRLILEISKQFQMDLNDETSELASIQYESEEIKYDHKIFNEENEERGVKPSINRFIMSKENINLPIVRTNSIVDDNNNKLFFRRISTKNNFYIPQSCNELPKTTLFFQPDFEKLFSFENYLTHNNYEMVVLQNALICQHNLTNIKARFKSNRVYLNVKKQFIKQLREKRQTQFFRDNQKINLKSNSYEVDSKVKRFFKKESVKSVNTMLKDKDDIKLFLKKLAYKKKRAKILGWFKNIRDWILDKR